MLLGSMGIWVRQWEKAKKKRCTGKTWARVEEIVQENWKNGCCYIPIISYQTNMHCFKVRGSANRYPQYTMGQLVELYYNPQDAQEFLLQEQLRPSVGNDLLASALICLLLACLSPVIVWFLK